MGGSPPPARSAHTAVWTGSEMIIWGGEAAGTALGDGSRYDPSGPSWTTLPTAGAPAARHGHSAIWTGSEMIVWGGTDGSSFFGSGARYNPTSDTWTALPSVGAPVARAEHSAVWTGSEMIVWGGTNASGVLAGGARYNPASDSWSPLSATNAPDARRAHHAVWTDNEMIIWGGMDNDHALRTGARYDPAANLWTAMTLVGAPTARREALAAWTGSEMIIWGGTDGSTALGSGARYNPSSDAWADLSSVGAPAPRSGHAGGWNGYEFIVWGGDSSSDKLDNGARYRPNDDAWLPLATQDAPAARSAHTSVWTGRRFLFWGGFGTSSALADGAGYCACDAQPGTNDASCDDVDDDCDGSLDEDYLPTDTSCGVGACARSGQLSCTDGVETDDCTPGTPASNDASCDGIDDDCDASLDEDFVSSPTSCGVGSCAANGTLSCSGGTTSDDCTPGLPKPERCDGLDNDCDGSIDEDAGTRYVAPAAAGGSDENNNCLDHDHPCATLSHAIELACDHETISVAEGEYHEDVLVDRPLTIDGEGVPTKTILRGTGATDVVRIWSSDVKWTSVNVYDTPKVACMHVGDAAHPGLRNVRVENTSLAFCAIGMIWERTGHPGPNGAWNSFLAASTRNNAYDGTPDSGTGTLMIGGNGKIQFKVGHLTDNEGAGLIMRPASDGSNKEIVFAGEIIGHNGFVADASSRVGVEIHGAQDLRFEGNDFVNHAERALLLDDVGSGTFYCNRVRNNQHGARLTSGTTAFDIRQNHFTGQSGTALLIDGATGAGLTIAENSFQSNALALDHQGDGTLDIRHNWWAAVDGPGGTGPGSGDSVAGTVNTANFIARADEPLYIRRPFDSGWNAGAKTCYTKIQKAIDAATPDALLLVGPGNYREHVSLSKSLEIEGVDGAGACSPSVIDATQSSGTRQPGLHIEGTSGIKLRRVTIEKAGHGVSCGQAEAGQYGLELVDVSSSLFEDLCVRQSGFDEIRIYGNSDNNSFRRLTIDGMVRDFGGADVCGHRSRDGILIDGGPTCEGGSGALAEGNRIEEATINNVTRAITLRQNVGTVISASLLSAEPASAWNGLTSSGVDLSFCRDTLIENSTLGGATTDMPLRLAGQPEGACVPEIVDTTGTRIEGNRIQQARQAGLRIFRGSGDPGRVLGTRVNCNAFKDNTEGLRADDTGGSGDPDTVIDDNDISGNNAGIINNGIKTLIADSNWWGGTDGPGGDGPGTGDTVSGAISYAGWMSSSPRSDDDGDLMTECAGDCDDTEATVFLGADELCDALDNDCDGSIDEGHPLASYYRDADGDGFGDAGDSLEACDTATPKGYVSDDTDCDDTREAVHPGADELCDALDNNCDGSTDEGLPLHTWYRDDDGDGYGRANASIERCNETAPAGYSGLSNDCDDTKAAVHPGTTELCNDGIDNNCDGSTDGEDSTSCPTCTDGDADGYVVCDASCVPSAQQNCGECDDTNAAILPGAEEVCDGVDNDCDGSSDEGFATTSWYRDADDDNYGDPNTTTANCDATPPNGYLATAGDCDDNDPQRNPGVSETCDDDIDNNCDGLTDGEDTVACPPPPTCADADDDGYALCDGVCAPAEGKLCGDCFDTRADVHPGAIELCDTVDNDCDGSTDEDQGTRFVAPIADGGADAGNSCLDSLAPCATISHAIGVACDFELVSVAEGNYNEDIVVDHPVKVDGSGVPTRTIIRGSATVDVVRILSSDVSWNGVNVYDTHGVACMRIGDSTHTGLRRVTISNTSLAGCAIGAIWDSTGSGGATEANNWNSFMGASTRNNVYDGTPDSGTGTLMVGGNGRIQFKVGRLSDNDGPGLVVRAATGGRENREIVFSGETITGNGLHAEVASHAGMEFHGVSDLRFEGNDLRDHGELTLLLDEVDGGTFYCNRVRNNGGGLRLSGGTKNVKLAQNHFDNQSGTALRVEGATGPELSLSDNLFQSNALSVDHAGTGTLAVARPR